MTAQQPILPLSPATASLPPLTAQQAMAEVAEWGDLPPQRRADLRSAVAGVIDIAGPGPIPMACAFLNERLFRNAPAMYGLTEPRFSNLVSALRTILRRLGRHAPDHKVTRRNGLAPAWQALHDSLPTRERQIGLIRLMKFATLTGVAPAEVDAGTLTAFEAWLREWTLTKDIAGLVRRSASNWTWATEHVPGWPPQTLVRTGMRQFYSLPFNAYPDSFRADLDIWCARLAGADGGDLFGIDFDDPEAGRACLPRKLRPRTIQTRRDQIRIAAAALVASGRDPASITGLQDLVVPVTSAVTIMEFHWRRAGNRRTSLLAGLTDMVRQVATYHCRRPQAEVERIGKLRQRVVPEKQGEMTEENRKRLRALLEPRPYAMLLHYPGELLEQATRPDLEPRRAARLAMFAIAMEILLVCPLRRQNLVDLRLDEHLVRPDPTRPTITRIFISGRTVKNQETIEWPLPPTTQKRLALYIKRYRPVLAEPGNPYLFPGTGQKQKSAHDLAIQLSERVERDIGVTFNLHLMRHFAVVNYLRDNPGQYELVRRVLGHRSVATTIAFYSGLEADAAARQFNNVLTGQRDATRQAASLAFQASRPRARRSTAR